MSKPDIVDFSLELTAGLKELADQVGVDIKTDTAQPAMIVFSLLAAFMFEVGNTMDDLAEVIDELQHTVVRLEAQLAAIRTDGN